MFPSSESPTQSKIKGHALDKIIDHYGSRGGGLIITMRIFFYFDDSDSNPGKHNVGMTEPAVVDHIKMDNKRLSAGDKCSSVLLINKPL